MTVKPRA